MLAWFRDRYLDLLGSIYIYNEHRGYTAIDAPELVGTLRPFLDGREQAAIWTGDAKD